MVLVTANPLVSNGCTIEKILDSLRAPLNRDLKRLILPRTQCAQRTFYRNVKFISEVLRDMERRGFQLPDGCKSEQRQLKGVKGSHTFRAFHLVKMPSGVTYSLVASSSGVIAIAEREGQRSVLYIYSPAGCTVPVYSDVPAPTLLAEFDTLVIPWFNHFCEGLRFQVLNPAPRVVQLLAGDEFGGLYHENVPETDKPKAV